MELAGSLSDPSLRAAVLRAIPPEGVASAVAADAAVVAATGGQRRAPDMRVIEDADGKLFDVFDYKTAPAALAISQPFIRLCPDVRRWEYLTLGTLALNAAVIRGRIERRGGMLGQLGLERGPEWETTKLWLSVAHFPVVRDADQFERFIRHAEEDRVKLSAFSVVGLGTTDEIARALDVMQKTYCMVFGDAYERILAGVIERLDTGSWKFKDVAFLTDVIESAYGRFCSALHSDRRRSGTKLDSPMKCAELLRQEMEAAQASRDLFEDWSAFTAKHGAKRSVSTVGLDGSGAKKLQKLGGIKPGKSSRVEKGSSGSFVHSANLPPARLPCFQNLLALCGLGGAKGCEKGVSCRYWHVSLPRDKVAVLAALEEGLSRASPNKLLVTHAKDLREALARF
jgi:hypothetical protein